MRTSGTIANTNGKVFEKQIETLIKGKGYSLIENSKLFNSRALESTQPIYSTQVIVGDTIYNTKRKCDLILFHPDKFPNKLVIECKWQGTPGSVDEKYPFLVLNIKKLNVPTVIVLDGGGYKEGASKWLKEQVSGCLVEVWDLIEFLNNINKGYFGLG